MCENKEDEAGNWGISLSPVLLLKFVGDWCEEEFPTDFYCGWLINRANNSNNQSREEDEAVEMMMLIVCRQMLNVHSYFETET